MWYQIGLRQTSVITLVIVSSDMEPCVLDTQVKREPELSPSNKALDPKTKVKEFKYLGVLR